MYRMNSQKEQAAQPWRGPISQEKMSFWGEPSHWQRVLLHTN